RLQGQAPLFAHFPPDRCLGALASRDAPPRKRPLFATVRVAHQENGVPLLNHALDAEGLRPHEKPIELEPRIDHLDERSLAHGTSALYRRSRDPVAAGSASPEHGRSPSYVPRCWQV